MFKWIGLMALAGCLGGCASFNTLTNEVSTFGSWPAERKPDSYSFERLPSQQDRPEQQQLLENAASGALQHAGFVLAADPRNAQYLMQLGARVTDNSPWAHNYPLFWRGGLRYGHGIHHGPWAMGGLWGPGWGPYESPRTFEREVVLLIRDRKTGQLLYEARANNDGLSASIDSVLPAMFEAAMKDFPAAGPNPRNVSVQLSNP